VKEDGRGPTVWDTFSHSFGNYIMIVAYSNYKHTRAYSNII